MGLADDLRKPPSRPNSCWAARLRSELVGEELEAFEEAVKLVVANKGDSYRPSKGGATQAWLARVLTDNGHPIGYRGVSTHFKGQCACGSV